MEARGGAGSNSEKGGLGKDMGWGHAGEKGVISTLRARKGWGGKDELAQALAWKTKGRV